MSNKSDFNALFKFCAYVALVLAALLILVNNLLPLLGITINGPFFGVLGLIKDIALLIGICFGAWAFVSGKAKWVRVLFWIAVIIYIAAMIIGVFNW